MEKPDETLTATRWMILGDVDARLSGVAALAEPARRALYRFVTAQPDDVSREQAATGTGMAIHAAKFHLDKLVEEGLLEFEYRRPAGRRGPGAGRPAKVYRRSAREVSVNVPERRFELAAQILARAITDSERGGVPISRALREVSLEAGRALGHEVRARLGTPPTRENVRDAAVGVLQECGYEPKSTTEGLVMTNCPFHSLACEYTDLACGMNFDLMQGFLSPLSVAGLDATLDPAPGRCCVVLKEK